MKEPYKRPYDSTVARIAGNVASGLVARGTYDGDPDALALRAVYIAELIVALLSQSREEPVSLDAVRQSPSDPI